MCANSTRGTTSILKITDQKNQLSQKQKQGAGRKEKEKGAHGHQAQDQELARGTSESAKRKGFVEEDIRKQSRVVGKRKKENHSNCRQKHQEKQDYELRANAITNPEGEKKLVRTPKKEYAHEHQEFRLLGVWNKKTKTFRVLK